MAIFTIADLHLSTHASTNKSMEIFGRRWENYTERLKARWKAVVTDGDTVIVGGDISWALTLEEALDDLRFIDALPGKKLLLKGNHDFWWCTMQKHRDFFEKHGITTISFLFNNAHVAESFIVAGTRGWFQDGDGGVNGADAEKIQNRELMRLKTSLDAAKAQQAACGEDKEILVFTHFPPVWQGYVWEPFIELLTEYGVGRVFFGHIHGQYALPSVIRERDIDFHMVSADFLDFLPKLIV